MNTAFFEQLLKVRPKIKGDCLRVVLYLITDPGASVSEIANGTGISKSHVSENCSYLYQLGILKKYEYTNTKLRRVKYFVNYNFKV